MVKLYNEYYFWQFFSAFSVAVRELVCSKASWVAVLPGVHEIRQHIATRVIARDCGTCAANCTLACERSRFPRFVVTLRGGLQKVLYVCRIPRSGHLSMMIFLVSRFAWS
jgi:hypothetical protein